MSHFSTFEEIKSWQESRALTKAVRKICKRENVVKDFAFVDQVTRSARSVGANIAEGNDTETVPEFLKFLSYSRRSAAEVRSHLYDALDEEYISQEEFDSLQDKCKKLTNMIAKLMHYLRNNKRQSD